MAQQLNLFDARFSPQRLRFSARQGGLALAATLVLAWGGAQALLWAADRVQAEAQATQAGMAPLRAKLDALSARRGAGADAELARLRALDGSQRQVQAALDAGAAGVRDGHADLLLALARQASGQLWITGLGVSDDGSAIDLDGRMTDSSVLTDYLRRLNAEPRFKGRPFAQLTLKSADTNGERLPYTEFTLRSTPVAGTATTP
ncbi:MAG: PilN domain-containing protein [Pseudomonadota bacterium]